MAQKGALLMMMMMTEQLEAYNMHTTLLMHLHKNTSKGND
jgi:hypothetical protein